MALDVFGLAGNVCANINGHIINATLKASAGDIENNDGSVTPQYTVSTVEIEVQAMSSQDLQQIENISQQGDMRAVYVRGAVRALNRPLQVGGDILTFYGSDWLVTQQLEEWGAGEWSKVLVTRQMPSTS